MSLPTCGTNCTSPLPAFNYNLCNPEINNGQISKIFFTSIGNPMSNWASAVEWASRLDNDSSSASSIRTLIGIGDKPAPESTEKEISLGRKIRGVKKHSINFKSDETNNDNHNAFRDMECGGANYLMWYETRDGKLFGGNSGIEAAFNFDRVTPESYQEIEQFIGSLTWESQFMPEVIDSPITDTTGDQF